MKNYIPIKPETLSRFADNARRLGKVENELSPDEMITIFEKIEAIPPNAQIYYAVTAESVLDANSLNFESNAVGELTT